MGRLGSHRIAWSLLLLVATFAVYWPVLDHEFLHYDDDFYVTDNPNVNGGLTLEAGIWATTSLYGGNFQPLTWLSHALDCQLYGLDPAGHHLTNLLLHAANGVILFLWLSMATGSLGRSAAVAAFFLLHPLRVESVAWLAERKDVLSTFFGLCCVAAWTRFATRGSLRAYKLAIGLFALSLLSKPMLVTLPFVLLLLDLWPFGRVVRPWGRSLGPLIREKLPLFGLAAGLSLITLVAQEKPVLPLLLRLSNATLGYVRYLGKTVWPTDLAALYPYPAQWPLLEVVGAALLIALLTAVAVRERGRRPCLAVGWFWFLGTLIPTIGLVQVGFQSIADRYTYFPHIGLFIAVVFGAHGLLERVRHREALLGIAATALLLPLALQARAQVRHWSDDLALWEHTLAVTGDNFFAENALAQELNRRGEYALAIPHFKNALRLHPNYTFAYRGIGEAFLELGDAPTAMLAFQRAMELYPEGRDDGHRLGLAQEHAGLYDEATRSFWAQLRMNPTHRESLLRLAGILSTHPDPGQRNGPLALALAERACKIRPCTAAWEIDVLKVASAATGRSGP